jgi:hypothetical protein
VKVKPAPTPSELTPAHPTPAIIGGRNKSTPQFLDKIASRGKLGAVMLLLLV